MGTKKCFCILCAQVRGPGSSGLSLSLGSNAAQMRLLPLVSEYRPSHPQAMLLLSHPQAMLLLLLPLKLPRPRQNTPQLLPRLRLRPLLPLLLLLLLPGPKPRLQQRPWL